MSVVETRGIIGYKAVGDAIAGAIAGLISDLTDISEARATLGAALLDLALTPHDVLGALERPLK